MRDTTNRILILEPTATVQTVLIGHVEKAGYVAHSASSIEDGLLFLAEYQYAAVLADCKLCANHMTKLRKASADIMCQPEFIILAAEIDESEAVVALKRGAFDLLVKPVNATKISIALRNAVEKNALNKRIAQLEETAELPSYFGLIGQSAPMQTVYQSIKRFAGTTAPVLITGAPGTDKQLAARALHKSSFRAHQPFVRLDAGSFNSAQALRSALFGAIPCSSDNQGSKSKLLEAQKGTLFIDSVESVPLEVQKQLVEFLTQGSRSSLGGYGSTVIFDTRLVFGSDKSLAQLSAKGAVVDTLQLLVTDQQITIPELASRKEDIPAIVATMLKDWNNILNLGVEGFSDKAMTSIAAHSWEGELDELRSYIGEVVNQCRSGLVSHSMLPDMARARFDDRQLAATCEPKMADMPTRTHRSEMPEQSCTLEEMERWLIESRIKSFGGSIPKAAESLGISPSTIYRKREGWLTSTPEQVA